MMTSKRWTALVVLVVSLFVVTMDMTILIMALPELVRELEPSGTQQLWIVDIYSLVLGFIIPLSAFAINGEEKSIINWICFIWPRFISYIFRRKCRVRNSYSILLGIAGALIMPTTLSMIRVILKTLKKGPLH